MSVEDQLSCGRPSRAELMKMLKKFTRLASQIVVGPEITGVSWSSCQHILMENLMIKWVTAKFVPMSAHRGAKKTSV